MKSSKVRSKLYSAILGGARLESSQLAALLDQYAPDESRYPHMTLVLQLLAQLMKLLLCLLALLLCTPSPPTKFGDCMSGRRRVSGCHHQLIYRQVFHGCAMGQQKTWCMRAAWCGCRNTSCRQMYKCTFFNMTSKKDGLT